MLLVPVIINSTAISLSWGEVNCTERNGAITGYSVQYSIVGGMQSITINVTGDVTSTVIGGLTKLTYYLVSVAAINGNGIGPYSNKQDVYIRKHAIIIMKSNYDNYIDLFYSIAGISSINGSFLSVSNDLSTQQIQVNCYTFRVEPNQVTWRIGSELIDSSYQPVNGSQLLDSIDQTYRHYITLNGSFSVGMSISCNTHVNESITSGLSYDLKGLWTIQAYSLSIKLLVTISSTLASSQWSISYHIV